MCARVAGACAAGAVFGDCGVLAAAALARWIAGEDGFRPDGGEAVAEGRGVVSGGGQHLAGGRPPASPARARGASPAGPGERSGRRGRPRGSPARGSGVGRPPRARPSACSRAPLFRGPPAAAHARGCCQACESHWPAPSSGDRTPAPTRPLGPRGGHAGAPPATARRAAAGRARGRPPAAPTAPRGRTPGGPRPHAPARPAGPAAALRCAPPCASVHSERCTSAPLQPTIGWSAMNHIILSKETLNVD